MRQWDLFANYRDASNEVSKLVYVGNETKSQYIFMMFEVEGIS